MQRSLPVCVQVIAIALFVLTGRAFAAPPPVDAFLKSNSVGDVELSPDGRFLAAVQGFSDNEQLRALVVYHVTSSGLTLHKAAKFENVLLYDLAWVNSNRLLVTLQAYDPETLSSFTVSESGMQWEWRPRQVIALDANLKNQIVLLKDEFRIKYAADRGRILHWLPSDPDHILMQVFGDVHKVNVNDGEATLVERGKNYTYGGKKYSHSWMTDAAGNIRLRVDRRDSFTSYNVHHPEKDEWYEISRFRPREVPEIEPLAFSENPNILYVLARHEEDRLAVFEFNVSERKLGRLVFAHPGVDVTGALFTDPGNRLVGFRYVVHKPHAEYLADGFSDFDRKLERTFGKENFARPVSQTRDGHLIIIKVSGPRNPGTYYLYDTKANRAELIGAEALGIEPEQMGRMRPIVYKARDGLEINAYFTTPPGNPRRPPLVVMPHGGPESRDYLQWEPMVQFLATRGYAVLQPNFRGSDGFGKKFAEAGYRQWGLKMQDDITDGVRHLVDAALVDPQRICIVGSSYGGYAALAGAAFTPDLYKCAVSINGVGDLYDFVRSVRGPYSGYHYWSKSIGDVGKKGDRKRLKALSPARNIDKIKVPILLIAGEEDETVEVDQSRDMAEALEEAGKPHRHVEFEKEGHTITRRKNRKRMFEELENFLARHIGSAPEPSPDSSAAR
ncbi:MAG: alpha/beta hydrolase family protein [Alphaproteobacteria bacterium]